LKIIPNIISELKEKINKEVMSSLIFQQQQQMKYRKIDKDLTKYMSRRNYLSVKGKHRNSVSQFAKKEENIDVSISARKVDFQHRYGSQPTSP